MRINTNVSSLIARENAVNTNTKIQSSLEKLSSGLKINKASDDASGLAIADKLRTQATSIKQGVSNGSSAVSLLQIADKSMAEQSNILDVVKAKLIQANSDTTSDDGREAIRKDIKKLLEQLDNIAEQTNYNGTRLLDTSANMASTVSGVSSSSSSSTSLTTQNVNSTLNSFDDIDIESGDSNFDLTVSSSDLSDSQLLVIVDEAGEGELTAGVNNLKIAVPTNVPIYGYLQNLALSDSNLTDDNLGNFTLNAGSSIEFSNISLNIFISGDVSGSDSFTFSFSNEPFVISNSGNTPLTVNGTYSNPSITSTTTTSSGTSAFDINSSGLNFQIGEYSDDLINSTHIQSNTLGLGGGSEALVQTSGASNQNNLIASNESMIFSIDDGNSATIDANSGATNVTISGEVGTLSLTDTSGTLSNLDETTYTLLNALVSNIDGTSGSETVGGVTVSLSDGATITKSGGEFTLSNGGSLTFSDGYEIAAMDIQESSASGSISVSNATDVLVTNLSDSSSVAITSSASGSLTGGQTLISLKNLEAGELTQAKASQFQSVVDSAISGLNALRGEIGSTQNQVESAVRNLLTQHTNVKAAESIIRDVDYANESGNFNKQSIIAQAGSYAITQANSAQQNILRLLN